MSIIVKNTTILNPLDLLAPHTCRGCGRLGSPICNCCKKNIIANKIHYSSNLYAVGERSSLIGKLIHDYKYDSVRALASPLAEILNQTLPTFHGPVSIIPLPTITKHIRARGLDHTLLLAKKLARIRGQNYKVERLLTRSKNTVQVGADAKTRELQASTAYEINNKIIIDDKTTYLLLDDVWTTGSSMKAARKLLKKAGAKKITMAVLAVNRLEQD